MQINPIPYSPCQKYHTNLTDDYSKRTKKLKQRKKKENKSKNIKKSNQKRELSDNKKKSAIFN